MGQNQPFSEDNMKTKTLLIIGAIIIVAGIIALTAKNIFAKNGPAYQYGTQENVVNSAAGKTGDVQYVKLTLDKNYNYALEPSTLKKGIPVRMEVDMNTVVGCARSVTIPELGVRKYVTPTDNIIEFTPTKTGTFKIACSMNMYVGSFSVTDGGSASAQTQQAQTQIVNQPRTGGCGCGGGSGRPGTCGAI
jgi:plastocyanin domain-containing protein